MRNIFKFCIDNIFHECVIYFAYKKGNHLSLSMKLIVLSKVSGRAPGFVDKSDTKDTKVGQQMFLYICFFQTCWPNALGNDLQ